jgi:hypothetical protein
MLPTVRRYSQTASYSQMNNRDLFVQALLRPQPSLALRMDVHRVSLATAADRWYVGSGAIEERGTNFGFTPRPSFGATSLMTSAEASLEYVVNRRWSIGLFLSRAWAGEVVRGAFAGRTMAFGYIENGLRF